MSNAKENTFIFRKMLVTHSIAHDHVAHGQHASPIH